MAEELLPHAAALAARIEDANERLGVFQERLREANDRAAAFLGRPVTPAAGSGGTFTGFAAGVALSSLRPAGPAGGGPGPTRLAAANLSSFAAGTSQATAALRGLTEAAGRLARAAPAALPTAPRLPPLPVAQRLPVAERIPVAPKLPTGRLLPPDPAAVPPAVVTARPPAVARPPALPVAAVPRLPVNPPPPPRRATPVATPVALPRANPVAFPVATPIAQAVPPANSLSQAMKGAADRLQTLRDRVEQFGFRAKLAFAIASASVTGFVRAGLSDSAEGFQLGMAFTRLSREIAGIFLPVTQTATRVVNTLADALSRLSGAQQDQILKWSLMAAGAATFAGMLPKMVGGLSTAAATASQLAVSLGAGAAAAGPIGLAVAGAAVQMALLAGLFALAYARSAALREAVTGLGKSLYAAFQIALPIITAVIDVFAWHFRTVIKGLTIAIDFSTKAFVHGWNWAIGEVISGFQRLAVVFGAMADRLPMGELKNWAVAIQGALLDAGIAANKLRLGRLAGPVLPGGGGGHRVPTPMQVGRESGQESFNRLQEAALKALNTQNWEEQQVGLLQRIERWVGQIAGGQNGGANQPGGPVVQHG